MSTRNIWLSELSVPQPIKIKWVRKYHMKQKLWITQLCILNSYCYGCGVAVTGNSVIVIQCFRVLEVALSKRKNPQHSNGNNFIIIFPFHKERKARFNYPCCTNAPIIPHSVHTARKETHAWTWDLEKKLFSALFPCRCVIFLSKHGSSSSPVTS